jgi:hypothetical protein
LHDGYFDHRQTGTLQNKNPAHFLLALARLSEALESH